MPDFISYTRHQLEPALNIIRSHIYQVIAPLKRTAWRTPEPVPFEERQSGTELHLKVGDKWGDLFDCAWFHFTGQVPQIAAGFPVVLLLDVNGEMCVVDGQGMPLRGLTTVASDYDYSLGEPGKRVLPLIASARGGEPIEVWADAGCNDLFGNLKGNGVVKEASIAICHEEVRRLYYDFEVLLDSLVVLPETSPRHQQVLVALNDAIHAIWGDFTPAAVAKARQALAPALQMQGGDPSLQISAVGHAHIDLGWLWPIRETKRKGARTFATGLANMELYPDYIFAASQAQLFQWMKESYPKLYARIKQRVKEGRLEPQGALWVECDTNLTSGESLVRQIMHGQRFFREEFGIEPRYVWLPDTFGYSAALPGIMKRAGIDYFSTQKLSWSLINAFPHHSFHWQGIDGSSILVHMLPEETYNSPAAPRSIGKIEANYREKGVSDHCLMVFGIGDGGGGPGEEHLERLQRLQNFAGLSPVRQEWTSSFFEKWAKDAGRFPIWVGELYLERHQGTLTTNARNKWYNRRMEQALRELEWIAALASKQTGYPYPSQHLQEVWNEILLYQFHDILPGSSIKRVYDESLARYQVLLAEVETGIQQAQAALAEQVNTSGYTQPLIVFNSLSWKRGEWIKIGTSWKYIEVPSMGYTVADSLLNDGEPAWNLKATQNCLENDLLRVQFGENGAILSLYDKQNQFEAILPGEQANRLAVFWDPGDAWDFPMDYAQSQPRFLELVSSRPRIDGPCAILEQTYRIGHSELVQEISLKAGSAYLEFNSRLRWRETQAMLRALFPVAIQADEASFEIQFGHLRRPTHRNTTWDLARDEVSGHKWVDLSQRDHGVALLNDSKYGHKIKGHTIELNLLRSVPYPGPRRVRDEEVQPGEPHHAYTDQADHLFRYALYPHAGDAVWGGVVQVGYEFNYPLRWMETTVHEGSKPAELAYLWLEDDGSGSSTNSVVIETVKKAEENNDLVLRLYECSQANSQVRLRFNLPVKEVHEVDLLERPLRTLALEENGLTLAFQPFEIKTLRLRTG